MACVVLPLGAQTPWGPSTTTGLRGSLPGPVLPPPQGAPRLSPGTLPLQGPPSLERSSRCRSDAGRCRAQRDHCKTLAGCHCRGECPSGEGWKHQKKKSQALAPKVKIPLAPHLHSTVNTRGVQPITGYRASCSVHHGIIPCFSTRGPWVTVQTHKAAGYVWWTCLQAHSTQQLGGNIRAGKELKADTF